MASEFDILRKRLKKTLQVVLAMAFFASKALKSAGFHGIPERFSGATNPPLAG
tara:strand:- start:361 stop:519 length:159 start_codon:yes stop_codon:yes gene_type:complete